MQNNVSLANSEMETYGRMQLRHTLRQDNQFGISLEELGKLLSADSVCKVKLHPSIDHDVPEGE
jgi:hypothetical protein